MRNSGYKEDISQLEEINRQKDDFSSLHALVKTIDKLYGLKRRIEVFDGVEPFARELGVTFSGTDPHKKKGEIVTTHFSNMKRGQYLDTAAAYLAWLSYQHPKEAKKYCSEVGLKFRRYTGHPLAPKEAIIEVKSPATKSLLYTLDINPLSKFMVHALHEVFQVTYWKRGIVLSSLCAMLMLLGALGYLIWQYEQNSQSIEKRFDESELTGRQVLVQLEDNLSNTLDLISEQLAKEKSGCLSRIAQYLVNSRNLPGEKLEIPFGLECKKALFKEFASAQYFNNIDYQTRYQLLTSIIEAAQKSLSFSSEEIGALYLYRGLYAKHYNATYSFMDIRKGYSFSQTFPLIYTTIIDTNHSMPDNLHLSSLNRAFFNQNLDFFPWQSAYAHFSKYFKDAYEGNIRSITSQELRNAFNEIRDDMSLFGQEAKIGFALNYAYLHRNNHLIDKFIDLHGDCSDLPHSQNIGNCYAMLFIQQVNDGNGKKAIEYRDRAFFEYKRIKADVAAVNLFLMHRDIIGKNREGKPLPREDAKSPRQLQKKFLKLITDAKKNNDTYTLAILQFRYANEVVGFLLQDHAQAVSLIHESVGLLEGYFKKDILEKIIHDNLWRHFLHGDKHTALELMQQRHNQTIFKDDIDRAASLQKLSHYYYDADEKDRARSLFSKAIQIFKRALEKANTISRLAQLSDSLLQNSHFDLADQALKKMLKIYDVSVDKSHEFKILTTAFRLNAGYYQAGLLGTVRLSSDESENALKQAITYAKQLTKKDDLDNYVFKNEKHFKLYLTVADYYSKELEERRLSKKEQFERRYLENPEYLNLSILEAVKKEQSKLSTKYGTDGAGLSHVWTASSLSLSYLEEYFARFETWYGFEEGQDHKQKIVVPELLREHKDTLEAAYIDWKFGYKRDRPFSGRTDALVLVAITAKLLGKHKESAAFAKDAFDEMEGRIGAYRQHAFQKQRDAQGVVLHAYNIAAACNYIGALKILDRHKEKFKAVPKLYRTTRQKIFSQSELVCTD